MPRASNPFVDRRILGMELRRLREAAGLTLEAAAAHALDASAAKLSRIENARQSVSPRDVRDLCTLFGTSLSQTDELMNLAKSGNGQGWWERYPEVDDLDSAFIAFESAATHLQQFEVSVIPSLLQTTSYAKAHLLSVVNPGRLKQWTDRQLESWLEIQRTRQDILSNPDTIFEFILDETALMRTVGDARMHEQIEHIKEVASYSNVTVKIIPLQQGAHPGQTGGFTLLHLPGHAPDVVYLETRAGHFLIEDQSEIVRFNRLFSSIGESGLVASEVADTLTRTDACIRRN